MSIEIDPAYQEEINKMQSREAVKNQETEAQPPAQVADFLKEMRKQEMMKVRTGVPEIDAERDARVEEINNKLNELSIGETGKVKKFLEKEALQSAKDDYYISAQNMEELGNRLAEARVALDMEVEEAVLKYKNVRAELAAAQKEGRIDEIRELEAKALETGDALKDLQARQKHNFRKVQEFINATEALEKKPV